MRWYIWIPAIALGTLAHSADTVNTFRSSATSFMSGNELFNYCKGNADFNSGICLGFIVGVSDAASEMKALDYCPPNSVTIEQAIDTVKKTLTDHPEVRHYSAASTTIAALRFAFPCPKATPPQ